MSAFDKWKERYDKHWATKEQLEKLVALKILTQKEYETIVGVEGEINE